MAIATADVARIAGLSYQLSVAVSQLMDDDDGVRRLRADDRELAELAVADLAGQIERTAAARAGPKEPPCATHVP